MNKPLREDNKAFDPILTPTQWYDLCHEVERLVARFGLLNLREAMGTFTTSLKR